MKGEQTWGARMHITRQHEEKKSAKRKREIRDSHRSYGDYPSSKYAKGE